MKKILIFFILGIIGVLNLQAQDPSDLQKLKSTHNIESKELLASLKELLIEVTNLNFSISFT